ncbi:ParA family protein [Sphingomonas sp. M1A8_2b]
MKSIAFFNNKGGVGKTTLLCNVAGYLAHYNKLKICVVDADPQCNATQYFFPDSTIEKIYGPKGSFTIHSVIEPLSLGEGYSKDIEVRKSPSFKVDVIPGDPRLALTEDLLARDWGDAKAGEVRGIRTNLVFSELLGQLADYDLVLFDVSPSLGALNRAILLSADYFISPMSIDIFSLKAFENIAEWIHNWSNDWERGLANVKDKKRIPDFKYGRAAFLGYVTQQYMAKRDSSGQRRAVQAYETIRSQIDAIIDSSFPASARPAKPYEMGTVPNLFSLIPMSQSNHKPIFELQAKDGVVGAHFQKVKDAKEIFAEVADELVKRI